MTLKNQKGFTLIEVVVVLIILGIVAAFAVAKMGQGIEQTKIAGGYLTAVESINSQEKLAWSAYLISNNGTYDDTAFFGLTTTSDIYDVTNLDGALNDSYSWAALDPLIGGGSLTFQDAPAEALIRTAGTSLHPPKWARP